MLSSLNTELLISNWMRRKEDYDFSWVIASSVDMPFKVDSLKIGPDVFTHSLLCTDHSRGSTIYVPNVNVNPSAARRWNLAKLDRDTLPTGIYDVVAGYHQFGSAQQQAAFYLMQTEATPKRFRSIKQAYESKARACLPSEDKRDPSDYINVHASGATDSGSLGCFTIPEPIFSNFRRLYEDLEVGLLLFVRDQADVLRNFLRV